MADTILSAADAEAEFWKHLKSSNTGMLGLDQPGYHSQPMTAFREEETGTIWFFTRDDTDLARDAALPDQSAMFTYGSKDQEVWACIHGTLSVSPRDPALIDKYWNPILAAWYPGGKDDPHLTMLRFDADDGRIWVSKQGPVRFFYEVAKANLTKTLPDVGGAVDVNLN
ncbi:MAG: pyridoxamine 5'-phosphate oxidase family protein [Brevundimonas sp.]